MDPGKTPQYDEELNLASSNPKKPAGRKKFKETRHPIYRGIRQRNSDRWVCEVREPTQQKRIWLGTYPTAEMAARAHDVAALALRGQAACLNFSDSVWRLPVPLSNDPKDIQKAAVEAAEAFRPTAELGNVGEGSSGNAALDGMGGELMSPPPSIEEGGSGDYVESDGEVEAAVEAAEAFRPTAELGNVGEGSSGNAALDGMGGALMSPPPSIEEGGSGDYVESDGEVDLWNY